MHGGMGFYIAGLLYFSIIGRRLVFFLDSSCLYAVYNSHRMTKRIFIRGVAYNTLIWILHDTPHIIEICENSNILHIIIFAGCGYILSTLSHFVIYSVYYLQHATVVTLTKIDNSLHKKENDIGKLVSLVRNYKK